MPLTATAVAVSRRYTDPTMLLIPGRDLGAQRDDFCTVTGTDADNAAVLARPRAA